jgi:hypothetical protein
MSKKAPARKKTMRPARQPRPLPTALLAVAALVNVANDTETLAAALAAARAAVKNTPGGDCDDISEFIRRYAIAGPFGGSVAKALLLDPGNIDGDLHNAYAHPALLAGISLAYLVFSNDGGVQ